MPQRLNVLLIEDDSSDVATVRQALMNADPRHLLTIVPDGEAALTILRMYEIDYPYIILLDLYMPKMDGFAFLNTLRREPRLRTNIVFVLTASSVDAHKRIMYHEGIAGYLVKEKLGLNLEHLGTFLTTYNNIIEYPELQ